MIRSLHGTSQEAWEWVNEYLACEESAILANGGVRSGPQMISYDHFMEINKAWVNPEFDFGKMFGYKIQKWSKLISNYIDFDFLDIVKSLVLEKETKKVQAYTIGFKFSNKQTSGHGCLLTLVFSRRLGYDNPIVVMNIRSSEVTKRLLMDFLLVERIIEYIYGPKHGASLKVFCGNMYLSGEAFTMYHNYKDLRVLLKGNETSMAERILRILDKFEKPESLDIKFRVHLRAVKRLHNIDINPLLAKNLRLFNNELESDIEPELPKKKLKRLLPKNTINK
jgi:hypothetical protein